MAPSLGNPIPLATMALVLVLPVVGWSAWRLARVATRDGQLAAWITPGVAIALWTLAIHVASYLLRSFHAGLWVGTLAAAAAGVPTLWSRTVAPRAWPPVTWGLLVSAALTTALVAPVALGWAFHDELYFTGHMSIAAELQNGLYPPVRLTFPEMELGYHYGFSVLVAALTGLLRVSIPTAIDGLTLVCWAVIWMMAWGLGRRTLRRPWLLPLVLMFGAGLPFGLTPDQVPLPYDLLGLCELVGVPLNPPMISYFFQHPWGVALPVALAALLVLDDRDSEAGWGRYALFALLVGALAILELVLFLALAAALLVAEVADSRIDTRRLLRMGLAVAAAIGVGVSFGGFFVKNPDVSGMPLEIRIPLVLEPLRWIEWTVRSFGLLLPLGLLGLLWGRRLRLASFLLIAGGLGIINVLTYSHSWDILKFATVAVIGMAIPAAAALDHGLSHGRALVRWASAVAIVPTIAAGVVFPLVFAADMEGIPVDLYHREPSVLAPDDVAAAGWMRTEVGSTHLVYRNAENTNAWAQWAGIAQPWFESIVPKFGFAPERLNRRLRILGQLPAAPEAWRAEGICWLVLDPGDTRLLGIGTAWVAAGEAAWVRDFGALRVLRLDRCGS